jgi:hypothetical protein
MTKFPRFIQDKPQGIDKFDGASQEALSKAIAKHIKDNDSLPKKDCLPRIIGIEGIWGAGKSNVVKLIEKHLQKDDSDYFFFEYDAWGNQEDLQRRSLLEQLTDKLVNEEILIGYTKITTKGGGTKSVTWPKKLKLLLARKTETTTLSYPRLSNGVIAGTITTILTSIASLTGALLADRCGWGWSIIIALLPIIITLIVWAIAAWKNPNYRNFSYILAVYNDKEKKETEYEVISEEEPSVVEFKRWMQDVSDNLNPKKCRKLVIVFDNMDRLPAEKVKQLWSSIHTFFAETGFENIWVIIPYDITHLSCAFGDNETKAHELAQYFINKTFPVTFTVPKPVITDYKGIFRKLFEEAFGNTKNQDENIINRLYRLQHNEANIRDIIIFINRLVSLYKVRHDDVDIVSMAVYQLYKDAIHKDNNEIKQILSGEYLGIASNIIQNNEKLKAEVSALAYGVDIANAKQIPLTGYINNCIDKLEGYNINEYAETDGNFDTILTEVYTNTDTAKLAAMIEVLNGLVKNNPTINEIWENLASLQKKQSISTLEFPNVYKILLVHVSDETKKQIVDKLCNSWRVSKEFSGSKYVRCINQLKTIDGIAKYIKLPSKEVSPEVFIEAVKEAKEMYQDYNLQIQPDILDKYLSEIQLNEFNGFEVVNILIKSSFCDFSLLKETIKSAITNELIEANNAGQIFNTYRCLFSNDKPLEKLPSSSFINTLRTNLENTNKTTQNDGYIDTLSIYIAQNGSINIDDSLVASIAENIEYYADESDLIYKNQSWNNSTLNKVISYMIKHGIGVYLNIFTIMPQYEDIKSRYNVTDEELLDFINKWDVKDLINKTITDLPKLKTLNPNSNIYDITSTIKNDFTDLINQTAIKILLLSVKETDLINTIGNYSNDYCHRIINALIENDCMKPIPDIINNFGGLICERIASGNVPINDYTTKIVKNIDGSKLTHVFSVIRDSYCNSNISIDANRFKLLELNLRKYGRLNGRTEDVIDKIIKPVIQNNDVKNVIIQNADFYKRLIKSANNIDDFKSKLKESWSEDDVVKILDNN